MIIASFIDVGIRALFNDDNHSKCRAHIHVHFSEHRGRYWVKGRDFMGYCFISLMMSDSETGANEWRRESPGGSGEISDDWLDDSREFN